MTHRFNLPTLAALLLCGAMLASCGGGDAEAPPPPVGPAPPTAAPDTTPPTVTIANDVSAATATGPVTFTFVFSEDVGVSFDGTDIVVTGGTPGTFTRVGGTQATLVVAPLANSAGTMSVAVAAGRFNDIAGNANTAAATGSKAFDIRLPTAPTTAAPTPPARAAGDVLSVFSDAYTPITGIDLNPNWGQSTVPSTVTIAGNATRKYSTLNYQGIDWSNNAINVTTMTRLHIDVWTPDVTSIKVSIISNGAENAVTLTPTLAGWNSFDIDLAQYTVPNKAAIIQLKIEGTPAGGTLYFDNLYFWKPAAGGGGGTGTVLANFDTVSPPIAGFEGGEGSAVEAGPTGGSGNALKVLRSGGQVFALAIVTLPSNIPLEAARLTISARVHSPTAGIPMVLKLEGPGGNPSSGDLQANQAVVVGWQTLTWTVPAVNTNYNTLVLLPNLGTIDPPPGKAYYFDDIQLLAAAGGGGGVACGTTAPTCAPTTTIPAGSTIIYSDASTVAPIDKKPDWGQNPAVVFSEPTIAGNASLKYTLTAPALYEGIDWSANQQNVSTKATLHVDIWTADVASIKISLIGGGSENGVTKTLTAGSWNSIDIPLAQYTSPDLTKIIQMKLEPNSSGTIYVDNIYFHGTAGGGGGGGGTFTGGIFSSDYSGNLGAGTAKSDKNGNVGFFVDPRLFAVKIFEDGSVCGSVCNPGGVYNFYYGIGKPASPTYSDAFFGGFVNAPGNTTADASGFAKIQLKFWGDAESWEKSNFTAQVNVIVQGPTNAACTNPSGRPEISKAVTAQKIGAGSDYTIPKTDFVLAASCGGAYTVDSVWASVGSVVVLLSGSSNLNYVNLTPSTPPSYPTFLNIGPIKFIN